MTDTATETLSPSHSKQLSQPLSHVAEQQYVTNSEALRIAAFAPDNFSGKVLKALGPVLDKLLGVDKLRHIYQRAELSGLDKNTFSKQLLSALGINVEGIEQVIAKIPKTGKCVVVSNHPFGMVEGVIIANLLSEHRADSKVMANFALTVFKEISDFFIFADPIRPTSVKNTNKRNSNAIKACFSHVENGGLLMVFPAGKVSTYQQDKKRITDAPWNRVAVNIAKKTQSPILPLFISGTNSPLFHNLGRVYFRLRLFMLAHEMFKLNGQTVSLSVNNLLTPKQLQAFPNVKMLNDFVRLQTFFNDPQLIQPWPENEQNSSFADILSATPAQAMTDELALLPKEQHLVSFKHFDVYYGYQDQLPQCVREITRLREITFRTLNEGSGEPCDTDKFDATYMHLFIFDKKEQEIIGAYRIGLTDQLLKDGDINALYLAHMFNFESGFVNQQQPCMEMGRSFIVEKHQSSFHGLLLLWKGIGAFVCKNPQYRTLYGTVSLSKLYSQHSVSMIDHVLVNARENVAAKSPFESTKHPEIKEFFQQHKVSIEQLGVAVQATEPDGKDLPILVKQYQKLNANFHCIGIDKSFNHTPGLLLSVDLPSAPEKLLKLYLGEGRKAYQDYA